MSADNAGSASIRNQVASATWASLTRIAGGGFAAMNESADGHAPAPCRGTTDDSQWLEELRKISYSSVSFPNGTNNLGVEGKPHDIEVRAALMLFHRIRQRRHHHDGGRGERKGKRKRKQQSKMIGASDVSQKNPLNKQESSFSKEKVIFEIISDLGTRRGIDSIKSLASLLSLEMEHEMKSTEQAQQQGAHNRLVDGMDSEEQCDALTQFTSFADIRADDSGIICLVSEERSKQLYASGRIPCTHCIKWFKGTKGLWWHQLSAHGIEYSSATESAAGAANTLAIVPFQESSVHMLAGAPVDKEDAVTSLNKRSNDGNEANAFDMVKEGKLDEFINLVERGFCPKSQLDRNGASALHWATGRGRIDFVSYLIEKCNCCPNQMQKGKRSFMGRTPLHWAARNGHLDVVEYLVNECQVNIDATTSDGTTAFCWASWQGQLDIMKFLHKNGCDIHMRNNFGCNAVLWSAQGEGTSETFAWLLESGSDFRLINSNGHSALHKAAQRGSSGAIKWLVDTFFFDSSFDPYLFISPDTEGNCPSDLCGMEGHESLAKWLSKHECDCIIRSIQTTTSLPDLLRNSSNGLLPMWLQEDLLEAKANWEKSSSRDGMSSCWGSGCGVRRMTSGLIRHIVRLSSPKEEEEKELVNNNFNDID